MDYNEALIICNDLLDIDWTEEKNARATRVALNALKKCDEIEEILDGDCTDISKFALIRELFGRYQ